MKWANLYFSVVVFFSLVMVSPAIAQNPQNPRGHATGRVVRSEGQAKAARSRQPIMHVEVDLQPIYVQVKDSHGDDLSGLSAKDFRVFENGQRQKIAFFDTGNSPVSIAILVDSSDSMNPNARLGSAQRVAAQFMRTARPGDQIFAMDFTGHMGPFQRLTREQLLNPSSITLKPAPSGGSALYDAIATALCHLRSSKNPRQAVIVVTDGVDEYSRITLEQLIGLVRSSRAQLFMIGLGSRPDFHLEGHTQPRLTLITGRDIDNPVVVFDRLMKESGAESFIPKSKLDLDTALKSVSNMLESEYTLAYYLEGTSKNFRKIEVKVDRRGAHVLTRRFVGSEQGAAQFVRFDPGTCTVSAKFQPYPYESKLTKGPDGMIYREDFSSPSSGWPNRADSHYVRDGYELSNPKMELTGPIPSPMALGSGMEAAGPVAFREDVVAAYGPWWTDLRASVDMNASLGTLHVPYKRTASAGLVFRMNPQGYYALLVRGAAKKDEISMALVRRNFEGDIYRQTQIVPWMEVPASPVRSKTQMKLSVEDMGDRITVFVDGREVKSVRDDSFTQGLVGFVISGPGRVTFRNLVVEQK